MARTQPFRLQFRGEPLLLERTERIAVPRRDVEIGRDLVVIELGEQLHEVVRDGPARRVRADDVDLHAVVARDLIRCEPPVIEPVRRMRFGDGADRRVDFVEAAVLHAPEHRAPCAVQCIDGLVACLEPLAKTHDGCRRIADHGVVAAVLVIGLPVRDRRVPAVTLGHCRADRSRGFEKRRRRKIVVTARAERARPPVRIDRQDVRMAVDQPLRRRRGRRAHHNLQAGLAEHVDRAVEPRPVVFAGRRFDATPREFGDPHLLDAERFHPARVVFPHRLGPMFWVVANSEAHRFVPYALRATAAPRAGTAKPSSVNRWHAAGFARNVTRSPSETCAPPGTFAISVSPPG